MPGLPTPSDAITYARLSAHCRRCAHFTDVDLSALIARGYGATPIIKLPFRCAACGAKDVQPILSGGTEDTKMF